MKTTILLLLTAGLAPSAMTVYEVGPAGQSVMELTVEKTGLLGGKKHLFNFAAYKGTLSLDRKDPEKSTIAISIASASISCRDTWLSAKDLRKVQDYALKEMLAANRYPEIEFRSTAIKKVASGGFEVEGTLTLRGVSRPAIVAAVLQAGVIEGTSRVRLTDYGLKPPTAALGAIGTKNEMLFRFVIPLAAE